MTQDELTESKQYLEKAAPNGECRDCTVRALAFALDIPYWQAHKFLAKNGRIPKRGVNFKSVIGRKPRVIMGRRVSYHKCPHKTVRSFIAKHPTGSYIILVTHHALALKDGIVSGLSPTSGQHIKCYFYVSNIKQNDSTSGQQKVDDTNTVCSEEKSIEARSQQMD